MWASIGQSQIRKSKTQKLLGMIVDKNMKFDKYILTLRKKVRRKLRNTPKKHPEEYVNF